MRINYSHSYIIVVLLKNKEIKMYKKLLNLLKGNYGFYLSSIFFIFPLVYVISGSYPKYTSGNIKNTKDR